MTAPTNQIILLYGEFCKMLKSLDLPEPDVATFLQWSSNEMKQALDLAISVAEGKVTVQQLECLHDTLLNEGAGLHL